MDTKRRGWLIPVIIIAAVLIAAAVIAITVIGNGETVVPGGNHIHSEPVPVCNARVEAQDGYVQVAESDTYILYYNEPRFSIRLENKKTGAVLDSTVSDEKDDGKNNASWTAYMKSGIVINAIIGTLNTYQVDMNSVTNEITTWYIDNGIYAQIAFKDEYQFELGVEIRLEGDDLTVRIPEESIKENKEGTYISTVSVFPFLGYTYLDEQNGYMLVPDGNGALIYLDNKEGRYTTGFSGLIYGVDDGMANRTAVSTLWGYYETVTPSNKVIAPVFGMAHLDDRIAYLGVVESGEERCSVEVVPNGVMVDYNRCFAKFLLRDIYVQPLNKSNSGTVPSVEKDRMHSDLTVRYCLLSEEEADYSGMANAYRKYLLDSGTIRQSDVSYNTRIDFLGTDREEFLMGTTAVTMTTAEQAEDILSELRELGAGSMLSVYKGWQDGGLYNVPVKNLDADSNIGGNNGLKSFVKNQAELGNTVYLYNDALSVNADTHSTTYNVMKMVNKRTFENETYGQVYDTFYYLLPGRTGSNLAALADELSTDGIGNIALSGITDTLFSYSSKGSYYSRTDTMDIYEDAVGLAGENCSIAAETPNAYLWKYADAMLDMPLSSSDYLYLDREIPFISMVFKGIVPTYSEYVNFEANKKENFLQMIESGVYPSFYITAEDSSKLIYTNSSDLYSLEYESYRDTIIEYDKALREVAEKVGTAQITGHDVLENGLVKVTYSNDTVIYVNYTGSAQSDGDITVDALSYTVKAVSDHG